MEFNTTPSYYGNRASERGAGGKFKKPAARKPPATPYDRPQLNQTGGRTGWLAKLVDPAYRIISGSAIRILPSFISNAIASTPPPPLEEIHSDLDKEDPATAQDVGNDEKCTPSYVISRSSEGKEEDQRMGKLNGISEAVKQEEEKPQNSTDKSEISRIERLMQGKSFSRDEIMRLTEILNSRVIDDQEKKTSKTAEGDIGRFHLTHETPRRPYHRKQDEAEFAMPGTSTPLPQTNVQDEVGASPIDIARAYMGSRRLEKGYDSCSLVSKGEQAPQNRFHPPPSLKSSTCWPAAMLQDQHSHITPQSQRGYGLVEFPRTPYSRTLLPKSRDRQTHSQTGSRWPDLSAKTFQQSQSSIYSQEKTRSDLPHLSYGSAGPIRRIRNKFGSESRPKRSIFLNSKNASSPLGKIGASEVFLPAARKNLEVGQPSGVEKDQSVEHRAGRSEEAMPFNETVRKILEQLDRHKPTPAEKEAELKMASEWKKYPRNEISDSTPNGKTKSSHLGEFGMRRNNGLAAARSSKDGDIGTVSHVEISQEHASAKASSIAGVFVATTGVDTVPSFTFKDADSQVKNFFSGSRTASLDQDSAGTGDGQKDKGTMLQDYVGTDEGKKDKGTTPRWPFHNQSNGQNATTLSNSTGFELPRNAAGQASGTKPTLPSISINKPNPRNATFPDNGFGFTFPVAASSGALSEPPTPSIMPSSSASVLSQPADASTVPAYSFGTGKSAERLVFSFPSTSNVSVPVNASDLKYSFGTDRRSRLSFSAVGKATC
nr:nuclear pore complex protein NUP1 isoform X3 [Nicotiana tomentosiformis]